jgi:glyoxylase-like metal-dependent hydrolase (beta-lactamase superfamily II)
MSNYSFSKSQSDPGVILPDVINRCPEGTKMFVLNVGYLQADAGWFLRGANTSLMSNPAGANGKPERRDLVMYVVLIDHPTEGLILWETGCGRDYPEIWGMPLADIFARSRYEPEQELDAAIAKVGYSIDNVKHVVMGHLHLDHAGGLVHWIGKDVPIWVHKIELESAFYSCATGADSAVYQKHYLSLDLNWMPFDDRTVDLFPGITLHWLPGHTAGLCGMQVNLINSGTFVFLSDHAHVKENYDGQPQGWLARDHVAWFASNSRVKRLEKATKGKIVMGHDENVATPLFGKTFT